MKLFEWQQAFDGAQPDIPPEEVRQASEEFAEYVGRIVLPLVAERGAMPGRATDHRLHEIRGGSEADHIHLRASYAESGIAFPMIFACRKRPRPRTEQSLAELLLSVASTIAQSSSYELDEKGRLVRWDRHEDSYRHVLRPQAGGFFTPEDVPEGLEGPDLLAHILAGVDRRIENEQINRQMAVDMRVNGQPVGLAEVHQLFAVYDAAKRQSG